MIHVLGGHYRMAENFIMLLRMANNLKLLNCLFLEFSISYFQTVLTEMVESKTMDKGETTVVTCFYYISNCQLISIRFSLGNLLSGYHWDNSAL